MNIAAPKLSSLRLCRGLQLSSAAQARAADDCAADVLWARLRRDQLRSDAIRVLPHLLPKRRSIWWGALCVWQAHREQASEASLSALQAVLAWITHPSEAHRRACEAAAQQAEVQTSAGCLAMAAFWSTGSMSYPGLPSVAPPAALTARAVAGAVLLAAAEHRPQQFYENYDEFLSIGELVAHGRLLWRANQPRQPASVSHWHDGKATLPPPHWMQSPKHATNVRGIRADTSQMNSATETNS